MSADSPHPDGEIREEAVNAQAQENALEEALEEARHQKRRKRLIRWLIAFLILDAAIAAGLCAQILRGRQEAEIAHEEAASSVGVTQEMDEGEREALLDQALGEAHRLVEMTSEAAVIGTQAQMIVSNKEENACSVAVVLLLPRDGQTEEIGRTDLISPGWHVRSVALTRELKKGETRALARLMFYTSEGGAFLGATARQVLLIVE